MFLGNTNDEQDELIYNSARLGGLVGMLCYYIPLLGGIIPINNLAWTTIFFIGSSVTMASVGAIIGFIISRFTQTSS